MINEPALVFYRVYQDRNSMDTFYVDTWENIQNSIEHWHDMLDELFPVIEPVVMTQTEFDNLPEFKGY